MYEKSVSEPWFSLIALRIKKVEGRLNKGDFANMNIGDSITFTNNELGFDRKCKVEIKNITYYDTFQTYLENETLERCLPGIDNIEDGLRVYYKYYKKIQSYRCWHDIIHSSDIHQLHLSAVTIF